MNYILSQQQIKINPLIKGIMDENNSLKLEILNYLLYLSTRFRSVFVSQGTLAAKFGISREHVNKLLREWKDLGVIKYRQQGFNRSCIYLVNPLLTAEKNRIKFKLPAAMLLLSISSLYSAVFQGEITLSNIRNYTYKNSYELVTIANDGYGFYEEGYGQETTIISSMSKQAAIIGENVVASKERVMEESIMQQLAAAFYLNNEQAEQYSNQYSKSVVQKALQSFQKQRAKSVINNPKAWLARVLAEEGRKEQEGGSRYSNGKQVGHAATATNPHGHSPSQDLPNLTHIEHVEYLAKEILKFDKSYDSDKIYSRDESLNSSLHLIANNSIASMQREFDQLLALLDDPNHICKQGCVNPSLFLRKPKQQSYIDHSQPTSDVDYEEHLNKISADKSDPESYKRLVRMTDHKRIARRK